MTVLAPATDELFRVTIRKSHVSNPDRQWENNYEIRCTDATGIAQLNAMGLKLVDFEIAMHYSVAQFRLLRISTWEPDSVPYNPSSFSSLPLSAVGARSAEFIAMEPINICLDISRIPLSGRFGHIFYRAALAEEDVSSPAGKATLTSPTTMDTLLSDSISSSGIDDLFNDVDPNFEMVMIDKFGTGVRKVLGLTPRGVATVSFDHAWFNRT